MSKYNEQVLSHLCDIVVLIFKPFVWKYFLILVIPVILIYELNSGFLYVIHFIVVTLWARSAKLGGVLGWFIAGLTIFLFQSLPTQEHFVELILRAPARAAAPPISSEHVQNFISEAISMKVFWSLFFGLRGGFIIGLGGGMLGKKIWGKHPRLHD
ncbi:hypothetical protein [Shewanella chilikensis]|uniref:hypothetical protein n=1 Tax=Shewanella chilikensis TaxID=558541 RepID=UPI0030051458